MPAGNGPAFYLLRVGLLKKTRRAVPGNKARMPQPLHKTQNKYRLPLYRVTNTGGNLRFTSAFSLRVWAGGHGRTRLCFQQQRPRLVAARCTGGQRASEVRARPFEQPLLQPVRVGSAGVNDKLRGGEESLPKTKIPTVAAAACTKRNTITSARPTHVAIVAQLRKQPPF